MGAKTAATINGALAEKMYGTKYVVTVGVINNTSIENEISGIFVAFRSGVTSRAVVRLRREPPFPVARCKLSLVQLVCTPAEPVFK
jgi:hypothetical protein